MMVITTGRMTGEIALVQRRCAGGLGDFPRVVFKHLGILTKPLGKLLYSFLKRMPRLPSESRLDLVVVGHPDARIPGAVRHRAPLRLGIDVEQAPGNIDSLRNGRLRSRSDIVDSARLLT